MLYWYKHGERTLIKQQFGKVFTPILNLSPSNIKPRFRVIGLYSYDPNIIPKYSFKPNTAINLPEHEERQTTSYLQSRKKKYFHNGNHQVCRVGSALMCARCPEEIDTVEAAFMNFDSEDSSDDHELKDNTSTFSNLLHILIKNILKMFKRRKAINSRAVVLNCYFPAVNKKQYLQPKSLNCFQ